MKKLVVLALAAISSAVVATPGIAVPPQQMKNVVLPTRVVTGETECGTLAWTINIVIDITNFFDQEGNLVRQLAHVREDNTITNVTTGETFREGPDSFLQTIYFNPDGTVNRIVASGLQARVGNELRDVGRVVLVPLGGGRFDLVFAAGPHPIREAADDGRIVQDALPGFCALFE